MCQPVSTAAAMPIRGSHIREMSSLPLMVTAPTTWATEAQHENILDNFD